MTVAFLADQIFTAQLEIFQVGAHREGPDVENVESLRRGLLQALEKMPKGMPNCATVCAPPTAGMRLCSAGHYPLKGGKT